SALYISDIDKWRRWDRRIEDLIAEVDVAWLDGTFYDDAEVPGRSMDEIPHPFITESMQRFEPLPLSQRSKVRFIHLNHTNPALNADSAARRAIEAAGFHVAQELQRFDLAVSSPPGPATQPTTQPTSRPATGDPNPPAPGFDAEGSDAKAIKIADAVMEKMGGRRAWDRTRYVRWSFFDRRQHVWDKHAGRVRLERKGPRSGKHYVRIIDLNTGTGRAWREGEEVTAPGELAAMIASGVSEWINDSYWLVMPYKLKDTGVTLRSLGRGETQDGRAADVLELTFTDVGDSPQNKYHIWVGTDSGLVEQWAYFAGLPLARLEAIRADHALGRSGRAERTARPADRHRGLRRAARVRVHQPRPRRLGGPSRSQRGGVTARRRRPGGPPGITPRFAARTAPAALGGLYSTFGVSGKPNWS
ncbi:MAG: hypothetical protein ACYSUF_13645, partial [Planctomycetota bacterium]